MLSAQVTLVPYSCSSLLHFDYAHFSSIHVIMVFLGILRVIIPPLLCTELKVLYFHTDKCGGHHRMMHSQSSKTEQWIPNFRIIESKNIYTHGYPCIHVYILLIYADISVLWSFPLQAGAMNYQYVHILRCNGSAIYGNDIENSYLFSLRIDIQMLACFLCTACLRSWHHHTCTMMSCWICVSFVVLLKRFHCLEKTAVCVRYQVSSSNKFIFSYTCTTREYMIDTQM